MTPRTRIRFQERHYAEAQSRGARDYQEDFQGVHFGVNAPGRDAPVEVDDILLVLADGMGGENAGDVASQTAVQRFMHAYAQATGDPGSRLEEALHAANQALAEAFADNPQLKGMGCTLVALVVADGQAHFISVGDSILWRFRDGALSRLNADHSYGAVLDELARRGEMSVEKAHSSPDRHLLRSALTGQRIEAISRSETPLPVSDGDYFLLASDGLLTLSADNLVDILRRERNPKRISSRLIQCVEQAQAPEQDNATVQVLHCVAKRHTLHAVSWGLGMVAILLFIGLGAFFGTQGSGVLPRHQEQHMSQPSPPKPAVPTPVVPQDAPPQPEKEHTAPVNAESTVGPVMTTERAEMPNAIAEGAGHQEKAAHAARTAPPVPPTPPDAGMTGEDRP